MAHAPERPEKYVCTACQTMHAGTVASSADGEHQYEPPDECGCCGGTELVPEENWSHLAR
nr:hypothetical protein [Salinilacihabitans rarus]